MEELKREFDFSGYESVADRKKREATVYVGVEVYSMKKCLMKKDTYKGTLSVREERHGHGETQEADYEYNAKDNTFALTSFDIYGLPRHDDYGNALPGVARCYPEIVKEELRDYYRKHFERQKGKEVER